ncbi:MAG: EFR1 family ferrodoxin [Halodesulfovibrio sp.]|uniref:EFR1 family ferrodoxin n=1 Tax=Halodesulfovibrio sp. TaxID=1912772 RepID=UPI00359D56FC
MKIESVKLVYFSPTGTTKAVIHGIARGLNSSSTELIDITKPEARIQPLLTSEDELLVVAVPVYMGRVPALLTEWLQMIKAKKTPAVCVVVYGNREYENALLELKDMLQDCGCIPIAGAAFVGEHSFSNSETPVALGRPTEDDLNCAKIFGQNIHEKLQSISSTSQISSVSVPGSYPYGGVTKLWDVDFIAVDNSCTQCGVCADVCPVGAIDLLHSTIIDQVKCITCCACIKNCPNSARSIKSGPVKDASIRLNTLYSEPKKLECFL